MIQLCQHFYEKRLTAFLESLESKESLCLDVLHRRLGIVYSTDSVHEQELYFEDERKLQRFS